jgi:seryl-tRNA synthetase
MSPSDFSNQVAEIASLKATVKAQAVEIRDLKKLFGETSKEFNDSLRALTKAQNELMLQVQPMVNSAAKLEKLLTEADRNDGMKSLAKLLIGGGFIAACASALAGIYEYFKGLGG